VNPKLNAYWTISRERALAEARWATEEIAVGGWRGPLHGVPGW
jgi:aspartyl-tRNA(Asn)/glutamyl-tRNA(Gln) amidotransferase subunit A